MHSNYNTELSLSETEKSDIFNAALDFVEDPKNLFAQFLESLEAKEQKLKSTLVYSHALLNVVCLAAAQGTEDVEVQNIVVKLMEKGANPLHKNDDSNAWNCLQYAAGMSDGLSYIKTIYSQLQTNHTAKQITEILDASNNVATTTESKIAGGIFEKKDTALILAARNKLTKTMITLLQYGASLHLKDAGNLDFLDSILMGEKEKGESSLGSFMEEIAVYPDLEQKVLDYMEIKLIGIHEILQELQEETEEKTDKKRKLKLETILQEANYIYKKNPTKLLDILATLKFEKETFNEIVTSFKSTIQRRLSIASDLKYTHFFSPEKPSERSIEKPSSERSILTSSGPIPNKPKETSLNPVKPSFSLDSLNSLKSTTPTTPKKSRLFSSEFDPESLSEKRSKLTHDHGSSVEKKDEKNGQEQEGKTNGPTPSQKT